MIQWEVMLLLLIWMVQVKYQKTFLFGWLILSTMVVDITHIPIRLILQISKIEITRLLWQVRIKRLILRLHRGTALQIVVVIY